jgi:glycosyltransferase involved in cell wall biosynthesis
MEISLGGQNLSGGQAVMESSFRPEVSIIIPCYNQGRYLLELGDNLIAQTFSAWEGIIVNDGSTDSTRDLALSLCHRDPRFRYEEQANRGLSGARNKGISVARGSYFQFLDADDKLQADKLLIQARFLRHHPEVDIVYGDARYFTTEDPESLRYGLPFWSRDRRDAPWIGLLWESSGDITDKFLIQNLFPVNSPLIRRSVIDELGGFNENLRALEDWEYWTRCACAGKAFRFLDAPNSFALIRCHSASMSNESGRMDSAYLPMKLSIGRRLRETRHRETNFRLGIRYLSGHFQETRAETVIQLALANMTPSVLALAIRIIIPPAIGKYIAKPLRRVIPWPIQQIFSRITGLFRSLI